MNIMPVLVGAVVRLNQPQSALLSERIGEKQTDENLSYTEY